MTYTVKQLAELSGVSIRTLRYYDKIGLLKPAQYGENSYRYYEDEQLLRLQQILFFRELDFKLSDIRYALNSNSFNKITALKAHRLGLVKKIEKLQTLLVTLDKTVANLRGETEMTAQEMYTGFKSSDLPRYDEMAIQAVGPLAEELISRRKIKTKNWSEADWNNLIHERNLLLMEMTHCLHNALKPTDSMVQNLIARWYNLTAKPLYEPTKQEFIALCELNCTHPDFRKSFDFYDENLAQFVLDAARLFAVKIE